MNDNLFQKDNLKLFKTKTGFTFEAAFKKHKHGLTGFIFKMLKDKQKTDDVVVDAFYQALRKIDIYDPTRVRFNNPDYLSTSFKTWLYQIAINMAKKASLEERKSISIDKPLDNDNSTFKDFLTDSDPCFSNSTQLELAIKKTEITIKHLNRLKEPYRSILKLREIVLEKDGKIYLDKEGKEEQMSYEALAKKTGRNLSTIKSQIRQGRQMLEKMTKNEFMEIDENMDGTDEFHINSKCYKGVMHPAYYCEHTGEYYQ